MLKKQSKKLAIMLVLSMIASLFVGVGTASAANGVAVSVSRVISAESDAHQMQIGNLQIKEDSDYADAFSASGDSFVITLPTNLKWQNVYNGGAYDDANMTIRTSGLYTMTVVVTGTPAKDTFTIPMYVNFDDVEEGYAYATIDGLDSPVPSGDYAVANVLSGGTSATTNRTFTAGPDTSDYFIFRLTETTVGTFDGATDTIKLTLPKNIDFKKLTVDGLGGFSGSADLSAYLDDNKAKFNVSDLKAKGITFTTATDTARGILEFRADVDIDSAAKAGAINLDIEGTDKVDDATIKVGTVAEYGVALNVEDAKTVLAGRVCQELGTVTIYENVADTLSEDRTITIELPDGVQFANTRANGAYKVKVTKGSGTITYTEEEDESKASFKVTGMSKTSRTKIEVEMSKLNIEPTFVGDIVAKVSGRAGVEGEVVIGTVVAPVEVAVSNVADVKIGYQAQALADITVTEVEAGALIEDGVFRIELPTGVAFQDKEVDVEVTEGNLEVKNVKVNAPTSKNNGYVEFTVKSESSASQPSTITISGLYLDVDRTVAEGPIKAVVYGDAVAVSEFDYVGTTAFDEEYDITYAKAADIEDYLFDNDGEYGRFVIANCVTPGVGEVTNGAVGATSTFVIGSTAAVIAGADSVMPVAPYISNSRTLLPVRYVAYACGVPEANVIWNPDNQTVTLLNNNGTVVQLTIGSTTMQVNGVAVIMDVAPQITNGYTFLPARYVANAFGYDASWEAATQTVTISPIQ